MPSSEDKSPKVKFPAYNCVPGRSGWEEFKLLLVTHGSKANDYGDSLATCILGTNIGGANGAGFPGTTPAQIQYAQRAGRKLHSETLEYLCTHIADSCHRDYIQRNFGVLNLAKPDPHGAYLYLMQECDVPDCREGEDAHDMKWLQFSILKDIGKDEHTVTNAMKELRALNAKRPAHMLYVSQPRGPASAPASASASAPASAPVLASASPYLPPLLPSSSAYAAASSYA